MISPILVVGFGFMGKAYVKMLRGLGFGDKDLIVVDRNPIQVMECRCTYRSGALPTLYDLGIALESLKPKTVFVLVNTSEHWPVIKTCLDAGVENIFVEKPLVMPKQLPELLKHPRAKAVKWGIGYHINSSVAMDQLVTYMKQESLTVAEGFGLWTKNRTPDPRPTAGDLEDEATHVLAALLLLTSVGQPAGELGVRGEVSRLPFVEETVQQSRANMNESYEVWPVSTSHFSVNVAIGQTGVVLLSVHSSFVGYEQERRLDVVLKDARSTLVQMARLEFDKGAKNMENDVLTIKDVRTNAVLRQKFYPANKKLSDQIRATLDYFGSATPDPRLMGFDEAVRLVRLSEAVLKDSWENDGQIVQ